MPDNNPVPKDNERERDTYDNPYQTDLDHDGIPAAYDGNEYGYNSPKFGKPNPTEQNQQKVSPLGENNILANFIEFLKLGWKLRYLGIAVSTIILVAAFPPLAIPIGVGVGAAIAYKTYKHFDNKSKATQHETKQEPNVYVQNSDDNKKDSEKSKENEKEIGKQKEPPVLVTTFRQRQQQKYPNGRQQLSPNSTGTPILIQKDKGREMS
jgi:hypothetical protein